MRFQSYFNTAHILIGQYDGTMPLVHFLKQYFAQHKKHGSKDRKLIAHLCYCFYRLGHALKEQPAEERLRIAFFLCNEGAGDWALLYEESWLSHWDNDLKVRIDFIHSLFPTFSPDNIFPWSEMLSDGIDPESFAVSHLVQPDLFLRIRPGKQTSALQKLTIHQISFQQIGTNCLALPNASKVDTILDIDKEVVVQDYSSQRVAEFFSAIVNSESPVLRVWDCCAASGGKSLLAYDLLADIQLTVSDIRPVILRNLTERFEKAGIKKYQSFTADLTNAKLKTHPEIAGAVFNIILCDVPCSGSGTWGRTPEQLYFFTKEKILEYSTLQKKIVANLIPYVAANGHLLYITCSVFKKENEEVVAFIQENNKMELVKMEVLKGYDKKADSMFAALFRRKG